MLLGLCVADCIRRVRFAALAFGRVVGRLGRLFCGGSSDKKRLICRGRCDEQRVSRRVS
jgi:hypothetical protein